ncbi:MAG: redox-active rane protein [Nitrospirae bacterium]|nr:redox-active rane protein [Nitrospirota bacterium]
MLFLLAAVLAGPFVQAAPAEQGAVITLFWGEGCPHCEREKVFLKDLGKKHPGLRVRDYEVWKNKGNGALYKQVLRTAGIKQAGVPTTVVGTAVFMGFNDQTRRSIEEAVSRCVRDGCPDGVAELNKRELAQNAETTGIVRIPFLGSIDPASVSLPVFTIIIGALDSFNPCAFFVLLFLLSLLIHARSRKRMFLIGGIFVLFSGLIYFLFMAAWLNVFLVVGQIAAITVAGGIVALAVGGINVKDFFLFKQGVSLVIPESAKPKLFERMRGLLKAPTMPAMIAGTIVLAISANAYELLCTAGFPMVYTRVLTLHKLSSFQYYQYLVLYNIVYVVPLAVIVAIITVTLGVRKLTEWQGRQLKLVSGLMMLSLGTVLIVNPALLNNALASVVMLAGVLAASAVIIIAMKTMRPEIVKQV